MRKVLFSISLLCFTLAVAPPAYAADEGTISGRAVTHGGAIAAGATLRVVGTSRTATADAEGRFEIAGLPPGRYVIEASSPRHGRAIARVELAAGARVEVEIELDVLLHAEAITVTAAPDARAAGDVARPVSVLQGSELLVAAEASLGETLARQPGVSTTYFGPGASRPVIRGLGGDRIRILDNGLGTGDVSSTSPDHAVGLEPLSTERIEIVRGPATLLYGSSAVGGVVNVIDGSIAEVLPGRPISGAVTLRGGTAADERAGAVELAGNLGRLAWFASGSKREAKDLEIPGFAETRALREAEHGHGEDEEEEEELAFGVLPNSAIESGGARLGLSWVGKAGFLGVSVSGFDTLYGVPGHAHGHGHDEDGEEHDHEGEEHGEEEPVRIDLEQRRVDLRGELARGFGPVKRLKFRFGHYDYRHLELEGDEVGTRFETDGWEGRLEAAHRPFGSVTGAWGLQVGRRDFEAEGEEAFVPPSRTDSWALFAFEEVAAGPLTWQFGARYESQQIDVRPAELPDRSFSGVSGSLGLVWKLSESVSSSLALSRSVTLPNPEALYSDGPHAATRVYEIGDVTLGEEVSLGGDLGFRFDSERIRVEASLFHNRVDDFIVERLTGEEEDGLPVVRFGAVDAELSGFEIDAHLGLVHAHPNHLELHLSLDGVRAEERASGQPLPRIPPLRYGVGLNYQSESWFGKIEAMRVAKQDRLAAFETETAASTRIDAAIGYRFFLAGTVHDVVLSGRNLTDQESRVHASYLKDLAPLPGRDLRLSYRLAF